MTRFLFTLSAFMMVLAASAASPIEKLNSIIDKIELDEAASSQIYFTEKRAPGSTVVVKSSRYIEFEDPKETYVKQLTQAIISLRSKATAYQVYNERSRRCYSLTVIEGNYIYKIDFMPESRKKWLIRVDCNLQKSVALDSYGCPT